MFRLTRIISLVSPFSLPSSSLLAPTTFFFSTQQQTDRVLGFVQNEKKEQNIDRICVEIASLSSDAKDEAVKQVLRKIFSREFSPAVILHQKFNLHLKLFPDHYFEAYFYRIIEAMSRLLMFVEEKEQTGIKMAVKQINDSFAICFQTLKRLEPDYAVLKQIDLLKTFAHYHANYLQFIVPKQKAEDCLIKSKQFLNKAIPQIFQKIKVQNEKQKKLSTRPKVEETVQEEAARQQSLQDFKDNRYELVQSLADALLQLNDIEEQHDVFLMTKKNEEEGKGDQDEEVDFPGLGDKIVYLHAEAVYVLEPLMAKALESYQSFQDRRYDSPFYHKLKKNYLEIKHAKKVKEAEKSSSNIQVLKKTLENKFLQANQQFFLESFKDFRKILKESGESEHISEFAFFLVAIRLHWVDLTENSEYQKAANLGNDIQNIIKVIEDLSLRKQVLSQIITQLQESFGIDISRFVEKIPRAMRANQRSRQLK